MHSCLARAIVLHSSSLNPRNPWFCGFVVVGHDTPVLQLPIHCTLTFVQIVAKCPK